jgi:hypothetical protein
MRGMRAQLRAEVSTEHREKKEQTVSFGERSERSMKHLFV